MPSSQTRPFVFYGYSAELLSRWCAVSLKTAELYKAGLRKPSRQAMRLFALHRDDRVLPLEWKGFRLLPDRIVDPAGQGTTRTQLESYALVMQWAAHIASQDPEKQRAFYELLKRA